MGDVERGGEEDVPVCDPFRSRTRHVPERRSLVPVEAEAVRAITDDQLAEEKVDHVAVGFHLLFGCDELQRLLELTPLQKLFRCLEEGANHVAFPRKLLFQSGTRSQLHSHLVLLCG